MASTGVLTGLMKWLGREEWRAPFEEFTERHLGPACAKARVTPDGLADMLGEQGAGVLWGCIFEDFMASDLDGGRNIVDDYLKRRGWKESVSNKRYLTGLRASVMSLYEVSDIVLDQSFLARDLLRGGEAVRVSEKAATRTLKQWDRLAARVVKVGAKFEMAGGVLAFSHELSEDVRDGFARHKKEMRLEVRKFAGKRSGDNKVDLLALDTVILRDGAFLFTNIWLDDACARILKPQLPRILNSDGDEIVWTTVRYPREKAAGRQALERALTALPGFHRVDENLWQWSAPAMRAAGGATETSMGQVELEAKAVTLETNSPQRAQRGRALLDPVIGRFVGTPVVESKTVAEMMASRPADRDRPPSSGLSPDEEQAIIHQELDRHYRSVLDEPVPMLGNVSPRKAARTRKGREKLVGWLKLLENAGARHQGPGSAAGYDTSWMWEELGVTDLRR